MFPKTSKAEFRYRKQMRELEISLILDIIKKYFDVDNLSYYKNLNILEFGCGDGFQIPYLKQLGEVYASDIYISDGIRAMADTKFYQCDITNTPFEDNKFDILFSNQVLEHIEDIGGAFRELKRIGKKDCIYIFSVPTRIWLILDIPAQYYVRIKYLINRLIKLKRPSTTKLTNRIGRGENVKVSSNSLLLGKLFHKLLPAGHGKYKNFLECYQHFGKYKWIRLFRENGLSVIKINPLLLYGPAEWPIIPINNLFNNFGICSSRLFLLKRDK
jgi:SAM-dependent methyltransferase